MDVLWIRASSQIGIYLLFALSLVWAWKRGTKEWIPLLGAVIYAVVFEHCNMLRYAHARGGYHYHPASWFRVWGDVPLYIPLAWGFILATSRSLTDHLRLKSWARPFCDALLALLIDLSLDAVAIRLNFWYWHGVGLKEGFFGVPADNFVGWLLVSFTFSALTRLLWNRTGGRENLPVKAFVQWIAVPIVAYIVYLGLEAVVHGGYFLFHAESLRAQLVVLAAVLLLFLAVVLAGMQRRAALSEAETLEEWRAQEPTEGYPRLDAAITHGPRHVFHLFGLFGLLFLPAVVRSPGLILLTWLVWTTECLIAWTAARRNQRIDGTGQ